MSEALVFSYPGGDIPDNYSTVNVTATNTLTAQKKTVPTGKRWILYAGSMKHDDSVSHTMTAAIYDENDKLVCILAADAGGGANGVLNFPISNPLNTAENGCSIFALPMKAGWYVQFSAGTAMTDATVKWEFNICVLEITL